MFFENCSVFNSQLVATLLTTIQVAVYTLLTTMSPRWTETPDTGQIQCEELPCQTVTAESLHSTGTLPHRPPHDAQELAL